jgi:hypothetical protein
MKFNTWLAATPLGTALKTFVAFALGAALADWATSGVISVAHWQTWVIGALVSSLPAVIDWLNPADTRYGNGSKTPTA